jgi:lysine 6-dehydrogenase
MAYRYAIIGSGRQGTAAAYDLIRFGEAEAVLMADLHLSQAESAAKRLNELARESRASASTVDASSEKSVESFLKQNKIDVMISAAPYRFNLSLTNAAILAGSGMVDLGGNSDVVLKQLELSSTAEKAGVTIIPDCGLGPGMTTSLALYAMEHLDHAQDVYIWDCGLPKNPRPPWCYLLTFSIEGLTNEYFGDCLFIRDGQIVRIPALTELESVEFPPPIGTLEAFTTSGGLTTASRTFAGQLRTLQNKTMRYPGHLSQLTTIQQLGLLDLEPIQVGDKVVVPRAVLHSLWEPQISGDGDEHDIAIIRVHARGMKDEQPTLIEVDLTIHYSETTRFTAMEQGTGWHASILAVAIASGEVSKGVVPVELAMSGSGFVEKASLRGFDIKLDMKPAYNG